MASIKVY